MEPEASASSGGVSARAIFDAALEIDSLEQRRAYVAEACAGDPELSEKVEGLLRAYDEAGSFLESPAVSAIHPSALMPSDPVPENRERKPAVGPGTTIAGRYRLLEVIGEGGMGAVWMAEQREPVRRRVALKLIKAGMDSRNVLARFEAERQALAMMDHPNIAKVHDGGTTEQGYPFFVMELVKGIPLMQYCDEGKMSIPERLALFVQICQAVQHAHQKGIIHRDLKPGNILVTEMDGHPVPKVIDFGLAKALQGAQTLTEHTLYTVFGGVVGTPLYMAPEQVGINALDVDTRTDIYALGVILYELLTGTTPLESKRLKEAAWDEIRRLIREEDPPRPSTRLSGSDSLPSIAVSRHTEPGKLAKAMRGELDWIVLKALEKDRSRRYQTANGLARDIERFLHDDPVEACPPSATYRLRKFARRNKGPLLAATMLVLMLVLLVAGLTVSNVMIARERNEKAQALARAEAQSRRAEDSFKKASIAVREVMTKAALGVDEWSTLPAPLRQRLADEAINFYQSLLQEDNPDPGRRYETAVGYRSIALLEDRSGHPGRAEEYYRKAISMIEELTAAHPTIINYRHQIAYAYLRLGGTLQRSGKQVEAGTSFQQAVTRYEDLVAHNPASNEYTVELTEAYMGLSMVAGSSRSESAVPGYRRLIALLEHLSSGRPDSLHYSERLARTLLEVRSRLGVYATTQEADETEQKGADLYEQLLAKMPATAANGGRFIDISMKLLDWHLAHHRIENAERVHQRTADFVQTVGERTLSPNVRALLGHLHRIWAFALDHAGRREESVNTLQQALAIFEKLRLEEPREVKHWHYWADTHHHVGLVRMAQGRREEAEESYRQAVAIHRQRATELPGPPFNESEVAWAYSDYAGLLTAKGQTSEAMELCREAMETLPDEVAAQICGTIATSLRNAQQHAEAARILGIAIASVDATGPDLTPHVRLQQSSRYHELGFCLLPLKRTEEGERAVRKALELRQALAAEFPQNAEYRFHLAHSFNGLSIILEQTGRRPEAVKSLREASEFLESIASEEGVVEWVRKETGHMLWEIGRRFSALGDHARAEAQYLLAFDAFKQLAGDRPDEPYYRQEQGFSHRLLAAVSEKLGKAREAPEHYMAARSLYSALVTEFPKHSFYREEEGYTTWELASLLARTGRSEAAIRKYRAATALHEKAVHDFPDASIFRDRLAQICIHLAGLLVEQGAFDEVAGGLADPSFAPADWRPARDAAAVLARAIAAAQTDTRLPSERRETFVAAWTPHVARLRALAVQQCPADPGQLNDLAWSLIAGPDRLMRDADAAVELAAKAVALAPNDGMILNTLGVARYRAGQYEEAIADLEKAAALRKGGDSFDWFFLAMCHWQLGEKDAAHQWYDKAVEWTQKNQPANGQLARFRAEAQELMGLPTHTPDTSPGR